MENNVSNYSTLFYQDEPEKTSVVFGAMNILGLMLLLENMTALVVLFRSERLLFRIRILSTYLTISDCLLGACIAIPQWVFQQIFNCDIKLYIGGTSFFSSFFTATLINVDRCVAILFPFRYSSVLYKTRLHALCIACLVLGPLFSFFSFNDLGMTSEIYCGQWKTTRKPFVRYFFRGIIGLNVILFFVMIMELRHIYRRTGPMASRRRGNEFLNRSVRKFTLISVFLFMCYTPGLIMRDLE